VGYGGHGRRADLSRRAGCSVIIRQRLYTGEKYEGPSFDTEAQQCQTIKKSNKGAMPQMFR
jgi:hypothetical protein